MQRVYNKNYFGKTRLTNFQFRRWQNLCTHSFFISSSMIFVNILQRWWIRVSSKSSFVQNWVAIVAISETLKLVRKLTRDCYQARAVRMQAYLIINGNQTAISLEPLVLWVDRYNGTLTGPGDDHPGPQRVPGSSCSRLRVSLRCMEETEGMYAELSAANPMPLYKMLLTYRFENRNEDCTNFHDIDSLSF